MEIIVTFIKKKMDPRDLNFPLRTGHSITGQETSIDWNNVKTIMSLMMVFNEKAMEDGIKYAEAAGRDVVLAEDLIIALKYNAVPSTQFYSQDNLHSKVAEWRANHHLNELVADMMVGGGSTEEEAGDEEEEEEFAEDVEWTRAPDTDDLARKMNLAQAEYERWNPPEEQFEASAVKRAIERAILALEAYNLEEEDNNA
jgi:hypothetical protein